MTPKLAKRINCELLDQEKGLFSVLGLVTLNVLGPYSWHVEDINEGMERGAFFEALKEERSEGDPLAVASVRVVDVTDDASELDVSTLEDADIPNIEAIINKDFKEQLAADDIEWTNSVLCHLHQTNESKRLLTSYVIREGEVDFQYISMRMNVKGRKVVAIGIFDLANWEALAETIYDMVFNIEALG